MMEQDSRVGHCTISQVYQDSNFACSQDCTRNTSGYVMILNNVAVTWASSKNETAALSTIEAEHQSSARSGTELIWLRKLWPQLGVEFDGPAHMYWDNMACLAWCASQQNTPMSKHIHIIHWWVSQKVEDNQLKLSYSFSSENVVDLFTKALFTPAFEALRGRLEVQEREQEME